MKVNGTGRALQRQVSSFAGLVGACGSSSHTAYNATTPPPTATSPTSTATSPTSAAPTTSGGSGSASGSGPANSSLSPVTVGWVANDQGTLAQPSSTDAALAATK